MPKDEDPSDALRDLAAEEAAEEELAEQPKETAAVELGADPVLMQQTPLTQPGAPRPVPPVDPGPGKPVMPMVLAVAGVVFALPAIWGALFLLGVTELWADRGNADRVAIVALLVGAVFSAAMFSAAAYFRWSASRRGRG